MSYKGIIFDLDGVICHTDHLHYAAWKQLADRLGIPFDHALNNRLRGVSRMESLDIILRAGGRTADEAQRLQMAAEKNAVYAASLSRLTPADLSAEVSDTLNALRAAGLKLAVGSSSKNAPLILDRLGLGSYFDAVASGNDITRSKPDPEVFLVAAARLGLAPGDCLVVEDAVAGLQAAHAGGMKAAGIGDAAENPLADYLLHTFRDLTALPDLV